MRSHLRGHQFFTSHLCEKIYSQMSVKIREILKQFDKLSFTTDVWSDPSASVSLLSLTAHGINRDFRRINIILKCETFEGDRHTGDIISEKFKIILAEWGISSQKVHCMIRDRGSNMIRAMLLANFENVDCTVHQLQLCIRAALECEQFVTNLVSKCKKISTHFNHSLVAQEELKQIQQERLNQPVLSIVQDCPTR